MNESKPKKTEKAQMGLHLQNNKLPQILLLWIATIVGIASSQVIHPGCQAKCGDVDIPYPFGTTDDCMLNQDFNLSCDTNSSPPQLRWGGVEVLSVSVVDGELRIVTFVGRDCYESNGTKTENYLALVILPRFPFSVTRNKFFAIGCDTAAFLSAQGQDGSFGCLSICNSKESVENGTCSGIGCCQANIPQGLLSNNVSVTSFNNHIGVYSFNPCSYVFVGEEESFNFTSAYLSDFRENVSTVLDWAVGDQNCEVAMISADYACKGNSSCYDFDNGPGYRCNCSAGFQGNPYIGCLDINECEDPNNVCEVKYCNNTIGNYTCSCPRGYSGDPKKGGQGCVANKSLPITAIIIGISVGLLATVMGISWLCWMFKKRKLIKLKEKFFQDNGGLMLQQRLEGRNETAKIYTAEELEKATDKYDVTKIIGRGGYGTVYKGILSDGKVVAIKKSKLVNQTQIEQFINEVVVLSQINHRNVVRLLGCCLETEVPLLVYEFVSNGTLFDHINNGRRATAMAIPWETRLRIAAEIAGVLSYLHSAASVPIIHRDVKSTNILLDENFTAKVSDFGASKLVPLDQTELSTMVQGTLGYLDPEYLLTSQLTEKSDVYSFGVVLIELLTGKKPLSFNEPEEERSLANYFLTSLKQDRLIQILEGCVVQEGNAEQLKEVANLAMRCLRVKGEERPTMKEVAMELEGLRVMGKHPWVVNDIELNLEETEYLLGESSDKFNQGGNANMATTYDSMMNQVVLSVADGR